MSDANLDALGVLSLLEEWTHTYGAALRPRNADTYGEGMRDAKSQVSQILRRLADRTDLISERAEMERQAEEDGR